MTKSRYERWSTEGILAQGSPEWFAKQLEIARTMAPIVRNPRIPDSASFFPKQDETPPAPGPGSVDLKPVEGINHMDRIAESFAQQDRIEALIKQRELVRALAGDVKEPEADPKAEKK